MADHGKAGYIEHPGIVRESDNRSVTVTIIQETACSGCHAAGSCTISGKEEKIVRIPGDYSYSPGDKVQVVMKRALGYTALMFGYLFPALLLISSLVIMGILGFNELITGLGSIGLTGLYYVILYFFRKQINNKFTFSIKSI